MATITRLLLVVISLVTALTACQRRSFPTVTIYESPTHFVRLEVDPRAANGQGYSHPVDIDAGTMASVLSGVLVQEPPRYREWFPKSDETSRHRAFSEAEVQFLAPLLSKGLQKATPEEIVTFYQTVRDGAVSRRVTSGGVFIRGDLMHVVLSNYRASSTYSADVGTPDLQDDRLAPMKPIAPQTEQLDFVPARALVQLERSGILTWLERHSREVVIRFRDVPQAIPAPPLQPQ